MTALISDAAVEAAARAYDAERCRLHEQWHGGRCEPMSDVARKNIEPMFRAALTAALPHLPASPDTGKPIEVRRHPGDTNIDEVVASGVSFHIEQMDVGQYWFVLRKGDDERHFWLSTKRNAAIKLTCDDEDPTPPRSDP